MGTIVHIYIFYNKHLRCLQLHFIYEPTRTLITYRYYTTTTTTTITTTTTTTSTITTTATITVTITTNTTTTNTITTLYTTIIIDIDPSIMIYIPTL